jgi:signal transduction histidine kinase
MRAAARVGSPGGQSRRITSIVSARATPTIDVASAAMRLASELLSHREPTGAIARRALDRFQRRAHACEVAFWDISDLHATLVMRAAIDETFASVVVEHPSGLVQRLRKHGALHFYGDGSVAEYIRPLGAQSFVMIPSPGRGQSVGTLVIGWPGEQPPCETGTLAQLRVAAGVVNRAVTSPPRKGRGPARNPLLSLGDRMAIVDRDGVILAANHAWRTFVGQQASRLESVRGANELAIRESILAVARGHSPFEQVPCGCERTATQSCVLTMTQLRHRAGGAAIVHTVSRGKTSSDRAVDPAATETARNIVAAGEAECRRVGDVLHDDFGQRAALLAIKLETVLRDPQLTSGQLRTNVVEAKRDVELLSMAMHDMSQELYPARLKLLGLERTLAAHCRDVANGAGGEVRFKRRGELSRIDEPLALCVFRVVQETLRHAVAHGAAPDIDVTLTATPVLLRVVLTDHRSGLGAMAQRTSDSGLLMMRERVHAAGGTLQIKAGPGRDTIVIASFSIARDARVWG